MTLIITIVMIFLIVQLSRYSRNNVRAGVREHIVLMALTLWWLLCYTCGISSTSYALATFFVRLEFLGFMFIPIAWLAFVRATLGRPTHPHLLIALSIIPLITIIISWLPFSWHLIYNDISPKYPMNNKEAPFVLAYEYNLIYKTILLYVFSIIFIGIVMLLHGMRYSHAIQRRRIIFFCLSLFLPTTFVAINLMVVPFPTLYDYSALVAAMAAIGIAWALLRLEVFELIPIARDVVMDNLMEGVLVLDAHGQVLDINPAASHVLGMAREDVLGQTELPLLNRLGLNAPTLSHTLEQPLEDIEAIEAKKTLQYTLQLPQGWTEVNASPLYQGTRYRGHLLLLRDVQKEFAARAELENAYNRIHDLNDRLEQENIRLAAELDIAQQIQARVLLNAQEINRLKARYQLDIAVAMQPAHEVSGDYYDILPLDDGVIFAIGDVTGHGLESGIVMLMVQSSLRVLLQHGERDLQKILQSLNHNLYTSLHSYSKATSYTTLSLSLLYYRQESYSSLSGQHEDILVLKADGRIKQLDTTRLGFPIGLEPDIRSWLEQKDFYFEAGDSLIFFTDGILEAENSQGERYELPRLLECLATVTGAAAETIKQAIITDVTKHCAGQAWQDDVTVMVVQKPA